MACFFVCSDADAKPIKLDIADSSKALQLPSSVKSHIDLCADCSKEYNNSSISSLEHIENSIYLASHLRSSSSLAKYSPSQSPKTPTIDFENSLTANSNKIIKYSQHNNKTYSSTHSILFEYDPFKFDDNSENECLLKSPSSIPTIAADTETICKPRRKRKFKPPPIHKFNVFDDDEKRKHIETEIVSTEKTYCDKLMTLLNDIIAPMFLNGIIRRKYFSKIISSIPQMIQFHQIFLDEIQKNKESQEHSVIVIFNRILTQNRKQFVSMYSKYVSEYNDILDLFATFSGNQSMCSFLKQMRKQNKCLKNYLILPIQRMPRYILLFAELKKYTQQNHTDYKHVDNALHIIKEIMKNINSPMTPSNNRIKRTVI